MNSTAALRHEPCSPPAAPISARFRSDTIGYTHRRKPISEREDPNNFLQRHRLLTDIPIDGSDLAVTPSLPVKSCGMLKLLFSVWERKTETERERKREREFYEKLEVFSWGGPRTRKLTIR
ncbi:hypothetical protein ABEB36_000837 [Hypothenemus hampei]|uniref:Uncharacterized protein n=1 Tax=Hypothenemus hampei TaxID=57062 RepID=A0ABD1FFT9_HYPHA